MNTLYNKIYIILLIIILSGCDKSPPQPDTWEKMMTNTMGVPQNFVEAAYFDAGENKNNLYFPN